MSDSSTFRIPGNIKQQFLPFVLDPSNPIHSETTASTSVTGTPQWFSFRKSEKLSSKGGKLQICPSSLTNVNFGSMMKDDVSYKMLYGQNADKNTITVEDLFKAVPGIQVREFLPDTKLDQCINFFGDVMENIKELMSSKKKSGSSSSSSSSAASQKAAAENAFFQSGGSGSGSKSNSSSEGEGASAIIKKLSQIRDVLWFAFDWLVGEAKPNNMFFTGVSDGGQGGTPRFSSGSNGVYGGDQLNVFIREFPYLLYYRLQSCTTTNFYELPYKSSDELIMGSDGHAGWVGGSNMLGLTNSFLSKIPLVGDILKNILGNVQINFMPWWDAEKGAATVPPEISFDIDLFNDTAEAAMNNFIFVNTIVPNNRWIQYGMFQHSPCLYDIRVEGYNRLFACAGKFTVKAKGVMRNMPDKWVDELCNKHANVNGGGKINAEALASQIKAGGIVKIPDVYSVNLAFQSLLPQNFNNYIFTYSQNSKMEEHEAIAKSEPYKPSELSKVSEVIKEFGTDALAKIKEVFK